MAQKDFAGAIASFTAAAALDPSNPNFALNLANACSQAGRHDEAIAHLQALLRGTPGHGDALAALGRALVAAGRTDEAIVTFRAAVARDASCHNSLNLAAARVIAKQMEAAVEILRTLAVKHPNEAAVQWDLAVALHGLNQPAEALATLARLVALRPDDANAHLLIAMIHQSLGNLNEAMAACRAALRVQPDMAEALLRLAVVLGDLGRHADAIEASGQLLAIDPTNAPALCVLGGSPARTGQGPAALDVYTRCLRAKHDYLPARYLLGVLLKDMGQHAMAETALKSALELKPDHVGAHIELGNVLQALGRTAEARNSYARAQALRPLLTLPIATAVPDFSVLALIAPGAGNTPYRYLIGKNAYECHLYAMLPGVAADIGLLRASGDIVLNLISDADQGHDMLASAVELVDRLDKPVINHPGRVFATSRDAIAQNLVGIARCRMPRTARCGRDGVVAVATTIGFPLLLRTPGTHGGDAFEKIDEPAAIDAFLAQYPDENYYVTEFVDYRSADGFYRKYRMMLVDGAPLPYHLAIADQWKIHHFRTEMGQHQWMQREEEAFLDRPGAVFNDAHVAALEQIARIVGLDFFGGRLLDRSRRQPGYRSSRSMPRCSLHDDNGDFAYKGPHVARIKAAFDAMLARRALATRLADARPRLDEGEIRLGGGELSVRNSLLDWTRLGA